MVFTDPAFQFLSLLQSNVRAALAETQQPMPFVYPNETFFTAYEALYRVWKKRQPQRSVVHSLAISRNTLRKWEENFVRYGALGLLTPLPDVHVDPSLERLAILVKSARPHAPASTTLQLADALQIPCPSLETIYRIQRSHGYGQRLHSEDLSFFQEVQKIAASFDYLRSSRRSFGHDKQNRAATFIDFHRDPFQHRVELFKTLASCRLKGQIRALAAEFGIHSGRLYQLRERYLRFGLWGLIDLVHCPRRIGEKIAPATELKIIEERLINPALSTEKMIHHLRLKCSRANVQKIYARWRLSQFKTPKPVRGVISIPLPDVEKKPEIRALSARLQFPDLVNTAGLKVNRCFLSFLQQLPYRSVPICNPGAILLAPFLDQLGIVEAIYTYGPPTLRTTEITNQVLVNILRIVVGFPTIHRFMDNSDYSVAIGAGLVLKPPESRLYRKMEDFRFAHLQKMRNDAALRARELNLIHGKEIAIDFHCDPSDSRYPTDKALSKSPDKNGDLVYAHRPQILWDVSTNAIINIAYCEGRSRAPSALYKFCEENLFQIIDADAIQEIYADSEYTGEKQLIYLLIRSQAAVTMCLKQNKKIARWKEEALRDPQWQPYGDEYQLTSRDLVLPELRKPFRLVVKQHRETNETRCFGSTHVEWSPVEILDKYHLRWPVETGIRDLVENYFLNHPPGTSPEKIELHYYCIMVARLLFDYFLTAIAEPAWTTPEGWHSVASTLRTTVFSNQNCELTVEPTGDLVVTYLDGDPLGLKRKLSSFYEKRSEANLNRVSWWGDRGVKVKIQNRFDFVPGSDLP